MRTAKALFIAVSIFVSSSLLQAADRQVRGTVKAVDPSGLTITLTTTTGNVEEPQTLDVLKKALISVNGQPAALKDVLNGQTVTIVFNSDLEIVTKIDAIGEGDAQPEITVLNELPDADGYLGAPWLSRDGLTIFWKARPVGEKQFWIWSAHRNSQDGLFEDANRIVPGNDPTVTEDGLEMILLSKDGLFVTTRASVDAAFQRPRKLTELEGQGFLAAPCILADGLTLYMEHIDFAAKTVQFVKCTRASRQQKWAKPVPVRFNGLDDAKLRFVYVTPDGKMAFCTRQEKGESDSSTIAVFQANGGESEFANPRFVSIEGKTIRGKFARYVAATQELFFARSREDSSEFDEICVIKGFDPDVHASSIAQASNDVDRTSSVPSTAATPRGVESKAIKDQGIRHAAGRVFEVSYPTPDGKEPQMQLDYTIWVPDGAPNLRGIIVHTHGNGSWEAGADAAYDLHWQTLAKKWDCALLAPSFHQSRSKEDLDVSWHRYFVPGGGSREVFLTALHDLAVKSNHPEMEKVPWCLWGHSAGAIWSGLMHAHDPDRIVAIWLRSGSGWGLADKGFIPNWKLVPTENNRGVPVILNSGMRPHPTDPKSDDGRNDALGMLRAFRPKDAPVGIAFDPNTGHNCGDSRLLAIPYFDTMLAMRLPEKGSQDQNLKPVDMKVAWLAEPPNAAPGQLPAHASMSAVAAAQYKGDPKQAIWLPNEAFAKKWMEYVKTGYVTDTTDPPAPYNVKADRKSDRSVLLTWDADVDFESGLRTFVIMRDGERIGRTEPVMERRSATVPIDGRRLFQGLSYHDTPLQPRREMTFVDESPVPGKKHAYQVIAVNSEGLKSKPVVARMK